MGGEDLEFMLTLMAQEAEGKGDAKVGISYKQLKLNDGGKPPELTNKQWNNLRNKDLREIDNALHKLGYDGELYDNVLRVFPQSVDKLIPIDL